MLAGLVLLPSLSSGQTALKTSSAIPVGELAFTSSGQLDPLSSQGLNDVLSLSLHDLSSPAAGSAFYGWLMPDPTDRQTPPLLLGKIAVTDGRAHFPYTHPTYKNLLAVYSGIKIAQQSDKQLPSSPPTDNQAILYAGSIPNIPSPNDEQRYSQLDHMRHLLAKDPDLQHIGLQGGLDTWLYRNTGKILEWAGSARDSWGKPGQTPLIHRHMIRILQYLDGLASLLRTGDLPAGTPVLVDAQAGQMGLLQVSKPPVLPPYLTHVAQHLQMLMNTSELTKEQRQRALVIDNALKEAILLLQNVRSAAITLTRMVEHQLQSSNALTLLNDIVTSTRNAYTGRFDPATNKSTGGIIWIHDNLQSFAACPIFAARDKQQ